MTGLIKERKKFAALEITGIREHLMGLAITRDDRISFVYGRNLTRSYHRKIPRGYLRIIKTNRARVGRYTGNVSLAVLTVYRSDESANSPSSSRWNRFAVFSRLHSSRYDNRIIWRNFSIHGTLHEGRRLQNPLEENKTIVQRDRAEL